MKALSIRQPWAWLIINRYKEIENRTWRTNYRGKFYIHAAKTFDKEGYKYLEILWWEDNYRYDYLPRPGEFKRGGIIGRANIIDCVTESADPHFTGPYGYIITFAHEIEFIPCRGYLRFFTPEPFK